MAVKIFNFQRGLEAIDISACVHALARQMYRRYLAQPLAFYNWTQ